MDAACMADTTLTKQCPDCGVTYHAHHPLCNRCQPCQRLFRNAETCRRDKARRQRQKAAAQVTAVLGLPAFEVIRDNGHRCRACRRVLFLNNGQAPYLCHECSRVETVTTVVMHFVCRVLELTLPSGRECCVCGKQLCLGRSRYARTCSDECGKERGRRNARDKYEAITGVRLRAASGPRPCRFCDRVIVPDHALGRGRDVCDYCNTQKGSFRARAHLYGVPYTHVSRKAVFRRDGWRCQLCGRKVKRSCTRSKVTGRLHPRTASLDHIVPMRRGGPHEEANCQCACLLCNVRKNARMIGQLRLF
jgi:hypothetical protein